MILLIGWSTEVTLEEAYKLYEAGFKIERDKYDSNLINVKREGE